MLPDAMRCDHAQSPLSQFSASTESEPERANKKLGKSVNEKQRQTKKYGACERRDDQLAGKSAKACELARFDQRQQEDGHSSSSAASSASIQPLKQQLSVIERLAKIIPGFGIILALMSSLFLGTAGMLVKLTTSVHGIQVAVLRNLIQLIIYSLIICFRGIGLKPARKELLPVMTRAILGGISITLSYCALKLIPLGDATTIRFSLPIWTLILSYFFLHESCSLYKISAVAICIAGVVLIARPDECVYLIHLIAYGLRLESNSDFLLHKQAYEQSRSQEIAHLLPADESISFSVNATNLHLQRLINSSSEAEADTVLVHRKPGGSIGELLQDQQFPFDDDEDEQSMRVGHTYDPLQQFEGCMMALVASIFLSISVISLRMCRRTPAEIIIFWLSASSVVGGTTILLAINKWSLPDNLRDVCYVLLNGLCGAIGQWFMTSSLKVEQSGIISLARTFDIEIAFLYSALLLGEQIRATSIAGSICVMSGVVIVVIPRLIGSSAGSEQRPAAPNGAANAAQGSQEGHAGAIGADRSSYQRAFGPALSRQQSDFSEHQTTTTTISRTG